MKAGKWKAYAFWIVTTELVGGLSGWLTREGTEFYNRTVQQPPLSPPSIVFPIVWATLYALMGVSGAKIWLSEEGGLRMRGLRLYWVQLAFNFFWTILFFNFRRYGAAFLWLVALWGLILWMVETFRQVEPWAGKLQIPYLLWVAFAGYLNFGVWMLNR